MAYCSFVGGSGRLLTSLNTPPFSNRHHPFSAIALGQLTAPTLLSPIPQKSGRLRQNTLAWEISPSDYQDLMLLALEAGIVFDHRRH
jgi:hypothetical protein